MRALDDAIFDIDVHRIPAGGREPAHLHFDVRFLVQAEHDRFRISDESDALAWVPAVGVDSLTDEESVLRMRASGSCVEARVRVTPDFLIPPSSPGAPRTTLAGGHDGR